MTFRGCAVDLLALVIAGAVVAGGLTLLARLAQWAKLAVEQLTWL